MLVVRSPVRISFGGGGTDLPGYYRSFGGGVLSAAINKYFYTVISRRQDEQTQIISADLRIIENWQHLEQISVAGHPLALPLAVVGAMGKFSGANLFLASEIPPGTGLGSSASVCVNLVKAVAMFLGRPMSRYQLAETAFEVARVRLQKPVGKQDEYAAAFGGVNYISFARDESVVVSPIAFAPHELQCFQNQLMLFDTGAAHNSWSILKEQEAMTLEPLSAGVQALHEIRILGEQMRQALESRAWHAFGDLLDRSWRHKRTISALISNPRIDQLYHLARAAGAAGGKITGAGGGGYLLLFCDEERQPGVRAALQDQGVRELHFAFDLRGTHLIANDPFLDGDRAGGLRWQFSAPGTV